MQNGIVLKSYSDNVKVATGEDQHRVKNVLNVAFKFTDNRKTNR
jgi:hypothetical protein